jgi:hypothetical protein
MSITLDVLKKLDKGANKGGDSDSAPPAKAEKVKKAKKVKIPKMAKPPKPPKPPKKPKFSGGKGPSKAGLKRLIFWFLVLVALVLFCLFIYDVALKDAFKVEEVKSEVIVPKKVEKVIAPVVEKKKVEKKKVVAPVVVEAPKGKSADELEEDAYQLAKQSLANGQYKLVNQALAPYVEKPKIYDGLYTDLMDELNQAPRQNITPVTVLAKDGYTNFPGNIRYQRVYAAALMSDGQTAKSVTVLESNLPDMSGNESYYALLSSGYMKLHRYNQANVMYRQLLMYDAYSAQYWLGLAMSFKALGDDGEANKAFISALNNAKPGWPAIAYIEQQLRQFNNE